jgi:hypothetical protein
VQAFRRLICPDCLRDFKARPSILARGDHVILDLANYRPEPDGDGLDASAESTIELRSSKIGSGSLAADRLHSGPPGRAGKARLDAVVRTIRASPILVTGRLPQGTRVFDLRVLLATATPFADFHRLVVARQR